MSGLEINPLLLTQRVCGIYDKEKYGESSAVPDRSLHVNDFGLQHVLIVETRKDFLGSKGLCCPNGRDDFFRKTATISNMLQGESGSR